MDNPTNPSLLNELIKIPAVEGNNTVTGIARQFCCIELTLSALMHPALRKLWRLARAPEADLGRAEVGPAPHSIGQASAAKCLSAMDLQPDSLFLDVGSGQGLVVYMAALQFKVACASGIEIDAVGYNFSQRLMKELPEDAESVTFYNSDACFWDRFSPYTHIYSFDADFYPSTLARIGRMLRDTPEWKVYATCKPQRVWVKMYLEAGDQEMAHYFSEKVTQEEKGIRVTIAVSREGKTIYLLKRRS